MASRHCTCGKKCSRNGSYSWPLMPDGLTPGGAARWQNKYSLVKRAKKND